MKQAVKLAKEQGTTQDFSAALRENMMNQEAEG